jgi:CheY-like chemotaxis protein
MVAMYIDCGIRALHRGDAVESNPITIGQRDGSRLPSVVHDGIGIEPEFPKRSSGSSNASTLMMRMPERVSVCRYAGWWWKSAVAEFSLRNPLLAPDEHSASLPPQYDKTQAAASDSTPLNQTLLLVEDNSTDAFVIRKVLAEAGLGLNIVVAKDGLEAVNFLRRWEPLGSEYCPALVLLDLNIPKISGIEILRHLRSSLAYRSVPVIVVTSSGAENDRKAAQDLAANGYFKKPTSIAGYRELGPLIRSVLKDPKEPGQA